jgi:hypothetical protein
MTAKLAVTLEDDLEGGPADETVRFGLDGRAYEIDLSATNARTFREHIAPFIKHARKVQRGQARGSARTVRDRKLTGDIRAWAAAQSTQAGGQRTWVADSLTDRKFAVRSALASVRAEGLEPEPSVVALLERYGRGELTEEQLDDASRELASNGTLTRSVALAR